MNHARSGLRRPATAMAMRTMTGASLTLLLAACVSVPSTRGSDPWLACVAAAPTETCAARIAAYRAANPTAAADDAGTAWQFQGRAALSGAGQGGNARIEWERTPPLDVVVLSAPITRQSWRLDVSPAGGTLHGVAGGPRSDPDAQALLREATGWQIPVALLGDWVHGRPARDVTVSEYRFPVHGDGTRLAGFDQAGWKVDIAERDADGRPLRLNAEQPAHGHRVRLVIDHWGEPAP